jgi:hypothetical protein
MKKKKFLTLVATGLMACLVAAMGGMTYSKYITSTSTGKQQATAAEWGFVVTADTTNLFGRVYDGTPAVITTSTADTVSVKANTATTGFIVAPGTSGSMTIAINGTAEVKSKLSLKASTTTGTDALSEICLKNYNGSAVNYYPITWTLKNGTETVATGTLATVLDKLDDTDATVIKANEEYTKNYTLSWEWPLEKGEGDAKTLNNTYDTIIGYKSYGRPWSDIGGKYVGNLKETEYADDNIITGISFNIDVTIEQIQ